MSLRETGAPLGELLDAVERFEDTRPVAEALAQEGGRLVREGFTRSRAPDGAAWAPLKRPRFGLGGPLWLTGELAETAATPVVTPQGFVMTAPPYGGFHQKGNNNLPARPFFPGAELPARWERAMGDAADDALKVP